MSTKCILQSSMTISPGDQGHPLISWVRACLNFVVVKNNILMFWSVAFLKVKKFQSNHISTIFDCILVEKFSNPLVAEGEPICNVDILSIVFQENLYVM